MGPDLDISIPVIKIMKRFLLSLKRFRTKAALFLIILTHSLVNFNFLKNSRFELHGGPANWFLDSVKLHRGIISGEFIKSTEGLFKGTPPPLFRIITAFSFLIFGVSLKTAIMVNMLYLAILVYSTFLITRMLFSERAGLFAAFLVSVFPGIFAPARAFSYDLALAAVTIASQYVLLKFGLRSLKTAFFTGLLLGTGVLTKFTFPLFVLPVFIHIVILERPKLRYIACAVITGTLISMTWILPYVSSKITDFINVRNIISSEVFRNNANYFQFFCRRLLFWPMTILLLTAFIYFFARKKYLLPVSILFPALLLSFTRNREPRQILPVLPAAAVMIAGFIEQLSHSRRIAYISLILFASVQFITLNYWPEKFPFSKNIPYFLNVTSTENGFYTAVDLGNWKSDEIFEAVRNITSNMPAGGRRPVVLVISPHHSIIYPLKLRAEMNHMPLKIISPADREPQILPDIDFMPVVTGADIVIYKTDNQGLAFHENYIEKLYGAFNKTGNLFEKKAESGLPDGSTVYIYGRRKEKPK